jgi:hypothetical protein
MENVRIQEIGARDSDEIDLLIDLTRKTRPSGSGEPALTIDLTLPFWMVDRLTVLGLEQKVDPRTLILQAIGDYLTTRDE